MLSAVKEPVSRAVIDEISIVLLLAKLKILKARVSKKKVGIIPPHQPRETQHSLGFRSLWL